MRLCIVISLLVGALALAGCGQSAQDKANKQVCSARADISKQVNYLKGLTLTTATVSGVENSLKSIGNSLKQIADAQPQLSAERKQQVQSANAAFKSEVTSLASNIGQNISISDAGAKLKTAVQGLADAYQKTLAPISCS